MTVISGVLLFVMVWWVCLFVILPIGIRNPSETGEAVEAGHDPAAPSNPRIVLRFLATTGVAVVIWAGLFTAIQLDLVPFRQWAAENPLGPERGEP